MARVTFPESRFQARVQPVKPAPATSPEADPALREVAVEFPAPLVPGRLVRRFKRFLAEVDLEDGQRVLAHCPNSGSMLGCQETGAPVYLSHHPAPGRRTAYTWEMIAVPGGWAGINTGLPNQLVALAAQARALPCFAQALSVRREVKISAHTRLDLLVELPEGPLYVEVKNVTLVQDGHALFPDAVTTRGAKHLEELMALSAQGLGAAMVYVVQHPGVSDFAPAQAIDPRYGDLLRQARQAGVGVWVVEAKVSPRKVALWRLLPLAF